MNKPEDSASQFKNKKGISRMVAAVRYSWAGLCSAWKRESAFRQEILVFIPASMVVLFLPVSLFQKLVLIGALLLVLVAELFNSAIEAVVDRVSLELNPLSKDAKDFGSAAVLLTLLLAMVIWVVVLYERFF